MPQKNIFKIYDERDHFWQWDTGQKLIVLDNTVDEVHFSNASMSYALAKNVYIDDAGLRVCDIPDIIFQTAKTLLVYACDKDSEYSKTIGSSKYSIVSRPAPEEYTYEEDNRLEELIGHFASLGDILESGAVVKRFNSLHEAEAWAAQSQEVGLLINVNVNDKWLPYVVDSDKSISRVDEDSDLDEEIKHLKELLGETSVEEQINNAINNLDLANSYEPKGAVEAVRNALSEEISRATNEDEAITRELHQINKRIVDANQTTEDLAQLVGVLPEGSNATTVVDYINEKTKDVVTSKPIEDLNNRVTEVEESIDTKIQEAVNKIMNNPDETINSIHELVAWVQSNAIKMTTITLLADAWSGAESPYSQVVAVKGATANSKIDLQPTAEQLCALQDAEVSLVTGNADGVVTVWAIGEKLTEDMVLQAQITEVVAI